MELETKRVMHALQQAIQAELEGHHFYRMAASTTQDEQGQEVFLKLADEELDHAQFLKAQLASFAEVGGPTQAVSLGKPLHVAASGIFSDALKSRANQAHFEMTALSVGIQLEESAIQFYKKQAEASLDPITRDFFGELASWEMGHYQMLLAEQQELKNEYWQDSGFTPF